MNALLAQLFPIREGEWSAAFLFFCIQASFAFGAAISRSVGFTLLIGKLGNEFLPLAFILVDLTVMLGSFSYAILTKKFTGIRILYGFVFTAVAFSVFSWLLFSLRADWVCGLFFVGFLSLHILISIHLISFTTSFYTPVQSKRVMAFIFTGIPVGGALGGAALLVLLTFFSPQSLVLSFGIGALGVAWLVTRISSKLSPHSQCTG